MACRLRFQGLRYDGPLTPPSLEGTLLPNQDADGSWAPVGPWGMLGGRNYSTALMLSCLSFGRS